MSKSTIVVEGGKTTVTTGERGEPGYLRTVFSGARSAADQIASLHGYIGELLTEVERRTTAGKMLELVHRIQSEQVTELRTEIKRLRKLKGTDRLAAIDARINNSEEVVVSTETTGGFVLVRLGTLAAAKKLHALLLGVGEKAKEPGAVACIVADCNKDATCDGPMGLMCGDHCGHAGTGEEFCKPIAAKESGAD